MKYLLLIINNIKENMETQKNISEEILIEHNGVYDDKWHIISPEGFHLPEGLEYLKNSSQKTLNGIVFKYIPIIRITNMYLDDILNEFIILIKNFENIEGVPDISSDLEIINCSYKKCDYNQKNNFGVFMTFGVNDLKMNKCSLGLKDFGKVIESLREDLIYNKIVLSENIFKKSEKDWKELENIVNNSRNISSICNLILNNNNFNMNEKTKLKKIFKNVDNLVL